MERLTVLVVDDNRQWSDMLAAELRKSERFDVCPPLYDGQEGLAYILKNRPAILILDILLPHYDGVYILNYIRTNVPEYNPIVYVISSIGSNVNRIVAKLQIDYFSVKPLHPSAAASNLEHVLVGIRQGAADSARGVKRATEADVDKAIDDYLYDLGAPLYRVGTKCVHAVLYEGLLDESRLANITSIYRIVNEKSDAAVSVAAVERNLRHLIKNISENPNDYFKRCFENSTKKISNTSFINASVYKIRQRLEAGAGS